MIDEIDCKSHPSLLHTNICSHQANIEKLEILLYDLNYKFDVIALTLPDMGGGPTRPAGVYKVKYLQNR